MEEIQAEVVKTNAAESTDGAGVKSFDELLTGNKEYQSEFDRRVSKAIDTRLVKEKERWKSETEAAKTEAVKLAAMSEAQRADHERDKRERALAEREQALTIRELKTTALDEFAKRGLPVGLAEFMAYTNADDCQSRIEALETTWNRCLSEAVDAEVAKRLASSPPRAASNSAKPSTNNAMNSFLRGTGSGSGK